MPVIEDNRYQPPRWLRWRHSNTMYPNLFRRISVPMETERVDTPDGDFITLAFIKKSKEEAVIVLHGLNGSYKSVYVQGLIRAFLPLDLDIYSFNQRGCGPELNNAAKLYHCGFTEDLDFLVKQRLAHYKKVHLVGVSLGANIILKYLGEQGGKVPTHVGRVLAINPPGSLELGSRYLDNSIYRLYFLWRMRYKGILKAKQFPQLLNINKIRRCASLIGVDRHVTAPLAGYDSVADYYREESWTAFTDLVKHEAHLLTAQDDPFFPSSDPPQYYCKDHRYLHCHVTRYGGHAGHFYRHGQESFHEVWAREQLQKN